MAEDAADQVAARDPRPAREPPARDIREIRARIASTRAEAALTLDAIHDRVVTEWPSAAVTAAQHAWSSHRTRTIPAVAALVAGAAFLVVLWRRRR